MNSVSWQIFFNQWVTVGAVGDLELKRVDGSTQRGPVKGIRDNGLIFFDMIWLADKEGHRGEWRRQENTGIQIASSCEPHSNERGFEIDIPGVGVIQLHRRNADHLDPSHVIGLTSNEMRQSRAWIYGMPLDSSWSEIIERVVVDLGSSGLTSAEEQWQIQEEAEQFA